METDHRDDVPNARGGAEYLRGALTRRGALWGLGALAGIAAVDVGGFAYAGGWLRPDALTPDRFADRFEEVYGRHDGFRRNHAKGLSATGTFTSTGAGAAICRAAVFRPGTVPVTGRFSLGGGLPDQPDKLDTVRGLGLVFAVAGQQWRTAMINIPVFTDSTPQGFYERLLASKPRPDTGKADPQAMAAFLQRHPETAAAMKIIKQSPPTAGFADSAYYGLNAFHFTNDAGTTVAVRWSLVPQGAGEPTRGASSVAGKDFLFDDLIRAVSQRPLSWRLMLTVGEPGDPTNDATKPWPPARRTIDAGTVTITAVHTEQAGNARDVNFDPLVLPDGITVSDDPLPPARSAVYARSFTRRAEEPKAPSEVNVTAVTL
ncbi:catalase-related peroxidase [Mycobacterium kubicae]|uniref:Catalase-related peroxidase n=1 Tax=Mycobacterium kubicae TaxID=120959 RepID=A0ABQ1BFX6_9MYCO|nr:catalase family peroxidase [Mycobacterium kubicae]GFG62627.1 catalase-related peroxidase [Mycobacterium kubicae]